MKKICILMLGLLILFANYSCSKSSGTGPKSEYKLSISIDYYGLNEIDEGALEVKTYLTKDDIDLDVADKEYVGRNFVDDYIVVAANHYVVIKINPRIVSDTTKITGDLPDEFDSTSKEITFAMTEDKSFNVVFGDVAEGDMSKYIFKVADANGKVEITVVEDGNTQQTQIVRSTNTYILSTKEGSIYTITAKAIADNGYGFNKWSGKASGNSQTISVVSSMAGGSIIASFETILTWNGTTAEEPLDSDSDGWREITKPAHIKWISDDLTGDRGSYKYKLMNNIYFDGKAHDAIAFFRGKIDGNGYAIKDAILSKGNSAGFVGNLSGGEIKNLTIDSSVIINVKAQFVGAIASYVFSPDNNSKIINCVNNANINNSYAGSSYVDSDYSGTGGIVGTWDGSSSGLIENCYNTGNITAAGGDVGGILGKALPSSGSAVDIKKSYNSGNITLNNNAYYAGGIAGSGYNISDSYNTGNINSYMGGGIIGRSTAQTYSAPLVLKNIYSTTVPTSNSATIGGIIGNLGKSGPSMTSVYFVKGSSSVKTHGYSSSSTVSGDSVNRTKTIADLATLHIEFGTAVWGTKNGRPVIKGVGEGK